MKAKICTDIQQSKELKAILPEETADMWWHPDWDKDNADFYRRCRVENIPAWSLSKLLALLPDVVHVGEDYYTFSITKNVIEYIGPDGKPLYSTSGESFVDAAVNMFMIIGY